MTLARVCFKPMRELYNMTTIIAVIFTCYASPTGHYWWRYFRNISGTIYNAIKNLIDCSFFRSLLLLETFHEHEQSSAFWILPPIDKPPRRASTVHSAVGQGDERDVYRREWYAVRSTNLRQNMTGITSNVVRLTDPMIYWSLFDTPAKERYDRSIRGSLRL